MAIQSALATSFNSSTVPGRASRGFGLDLDRSNTQTAADGVLAFDFDGNGTVAAGEITRSRESLLGFGGQLDLNGDGRITMAERRRATAAGNGLRAFDLDTNGVLSAAELRAARGRVVRSAGTSNIDDVGNNTQILNVDPKNNRIELGIDTPPAPPTPPAPAAPSDPAGEARARAERSIQQAEAQLEAVRRQEEEIRRRFENFVRVGQATRNRLAGIFPGF
jgi:hypothetical protein